MSCFTTRRAPSMALLAPPIPSSFQSGSSTSHPNEPPGLAGLPSGFSSPASSEPAEPKLDCSRPRPGLPSTRPHAGLLGVRSGKVSALVRSGMGRRGRQEELGGPVGAS